MLLTAPRRQLLFPLIRRYALQGVVWGVVYALLRFGLLHQEVGLLMRHAFIGLGVGLFVGLGEAFVIGSNFRHKSFLFLLLVRTLLYTTVAALWLLSAASLKCLFFQQLSFEAVFQQYVLHGTFILDVGASLLVCLLIIALQQISSLHGPGQLFNLVRGKYHRPQEVDRIFMFVDVKSSTTIAEELGNLQYSQFIQDFFLDLTDGIVLTKAEVYQYVGDEVVLTWPLPVGLTKAQCVRCFFLMQRSIEARKDSYLRQYGHYPRFKAGLHGGRVVATWVGEVKREIVYHGDVLNTTARIQSLCNELGQELLISEDLLTQLPPLSGVVATFVSTLNLRGRQQAISLHGLTRGLRAAEEVSTKSLSK
ncbi:adenylate/guanylate cyclase domain-containing protein [Hymenobacter chitinivorans]|uniref:Adenylate cyclase n=1 Tax=Hymenobacter chitinivorans DSM 11115 TaxID=1121954 RepID=A0A2M9BRH5_9BACT|nr:adenylate/guanylate cyclase domain-containing protein [Hymenobacter chitinivorans]PJJ60555.1 adenylate cyclase [Hymenobacter chitinivorans DSM 11115]